MLRSRRPRQQWQQSRRLGLPRPFAKAFVSFGSSRTLGLGGAGGALELAQGQKALQRETAGSRHAPASCGAARAPPCASAVSRKAPFVPQLPFSPPAIHPSLVRNTSPHSELGVSSCMTMLSKSSASRLLW